MIGSGSHSSFCHLQRVAFNRTKFLRGTFLKQVREPSAFDSKKTRAVQCSTLSVLSTPQNLQSSNLKQNQDDNVSAQIVAHIFRWWFRPAHWIWTQSLQFVSNRYLGRKLGANTWDFGTQRLPNSIIYFIYVLQKGSEKWLLIVWKAQMKNYDEPLW